MRRPEGSELVPGADLRGVDLSKRNLAGIDLRRADLQGADLRRCILRDADLRGAKLDKADLRHAHLDGADLTGAGLDDADLRRALLARACFAGASLRGARLSGTAVTGANFTGADLDGAWLSLADRDALGLTHPPSLGALSERVVLAPELPARGLAPAAKPPPMRLRSLTPKQAELLRRPMPVPTFRAQAKPEPAAPAPRAQAAAPAPPFLPRSEAPPPPGRYRVGDANTWWNIDFDEGDHFEPYSRQTTDPPARHRVSVRILRWGSWSTCIAWSVESPAFGDWQLRTEGTRHRISKTLGRREPQLGDPAFDDVVWIGKGEESALIAALNHPLREALLGLLRSGAVVASGRLRVSRVEHGWPLHTLLPTLCAIVDAIVDRPPLQQGLRQRIASDPVDGVRARALMHWLTLYDAPIEADPAIYEQALILMLGLPQHWSRAAAELGRIGTERAIPALTQLASGWLAGEEKKAARAAIEAITTRQGGLRAGGLSISETDRGGLSLDEA